MRFETDSTSHTVASHGHEPLDPYPARTMSAGSLALLFLREEVEQSHNAKIGDDPQQKRDDHCHKGNVGLWEDKGEYQRNCLKPKGEPLLEK